jgi:hypothetical protein
MVMSLWGVEHAEPDGHDELRVRGQEGVQHLLVRLGGVLEQGPDVAAAGGLRKLDVAAQESVHVDELVHRQ